MAEIPAYVSIGKSPVRLLGRIQCASATEGLGSCRSSAREFDELDGGQAKYVICVMDLLPAGPLKDHERHEKSCIPPLSSMFNDGS